jgi:RNA polymerase sigma-70 factor (ECF subfamily)
MDTTSASLLKQLRQADAQAAWARFVDLYTPLLFGWARRLGLQAEDAADLVQEVLIVLVGKLPELEYDPSKSFRKWLRTIALNKWRDRCRRRDPLPRAVDEAALPDVRAPDGAEEFAEAEYRQHLVARALEVMQAEFQPVTWQACWEFVVKDRPAAEVARQLGITVNAVYLAKGRVLRRLRTELDGLLD